MKTRQELQHSLLISQVIDQLTRVFKPDVPAIKVYFQSCFIFSKGLFNFCFRNALIYYLKKDT